MAACILPVLVGLVAVPGFGVAAGAGPLPPRKASAALPACTFQAPDDYAVAPDPVSSDDDDSDDSDPGPGLKLGASRCLFISGSVITGNQSIWYGGRLGRALGSAANSPYQSQLKATTTFTHVDQSWQGGLVTSVSIAQTVGDLSLDTAAIYTRFFGVGLMSSVYDAWTADDFVLTAIASSQSPTIASLVPWRGERALFVVSAEDPSFRRVSIGGYGGVRLPDLVSRWSGTFGQFQPTFSAALRQTPLSRGDALNGWAAQMSLKLSLPSIGDGSYVLAQGAYADRAPGYLGIHTTTNAVGFRLPGVLDASTSEAGTGFAGSLVGVWQFNPKWRVGGFVSAVQLKLPGSLGGDILSWRATLNTTWTPIDGLEFALEAAYAKTQSRVPLLPSGNAKSVVLTLTRSFP